MKLTQEQKRRNDERADAGRAAVRRWMEENKEEYGPDDEEVAAVDLLANIAHYVARIGSAEREFATALHHFGREVNGQN